jgi:pimeloyl-ACP methyl ester carboxylesterase
MMNLADAVANGAVGSGAQGIHKAFIRELLLGQTYTVQGYAAACQAIAVAVAPDYSKITAPVLILAGEDDKTAPMSGCETIKCNAGLSLYNFADLVAQVESCDIQVLPKVGHWHCIEESEGVAKHLLQFFS